MQLEQPKSVLGLTLPKLYTLTHKTNPAHYIFKEALSISNSKLQHLTINRQKNKLKLSLKTTLFKIIEPWDLIQYSHSTKNLRHYIGIMLAQLQAYQINMLSCYYSYIIKLKDWKFSLLAYQEREGRKEPKGRKKIRK